MGHRPFARERVVLERQPLALVRQIVELPSSIASRICRSTSVSRTFWRDGSAGSGRSGSRCQATIRA